MKNKKFYSFLLVILVAIALIGCGDGKIQGIWDKYVEGVNGKNLEKIAETFYEKDSKEYTSFIAKNNGEQVDDEQDDTEKSVNYFDSIYSLKTEKFTKTIECDFSSTSGKQVYYKAEVEAIVNGSSQKIDLYMYQNDKGIFFTNPIELTNGQLGNEPNSNWLDTVYYTNEDYNYSYSDETVTILRQISNKKDVVIPEMIDNKEVTTIGKYAFYQYNKILCFTTKTSKMKTLSLPKTLKTIGEYAFFQCDELEELVIPQTVDTVKEMAFTGCRGLETVKILRETENELDETEKESKSVGGDDKPLVIQGARDMLLGEIITLTTLKYPGDESIVTWSSESSNITVNSDTGEIYAQATGTAEIKVSLKANPQVYATVTIEIKAVESYLSISGDAFNRCTSLENLYIYAYNPNTIKISSGTKFNFTSDVKIYVPKGAKSMYVKSSVWSSYADQIYEME